MSRRLWTCACVALMLVACFALTGCFKVDETVTVNADGSVDFAVDEGFNIEKVQEMAESGETSEYSGGVDTDSIDYDDPDSWSDEVDESQFEGWDVEYYNDGTYVGAKMSCHIDDMDAATTSEGTLDAWEPLDLGNTTISADDDESGVFNPDDVTLFFYDEENDQYHLRIKLADTYSGDYSSLYSSVYSSIYDEVVLTVKLPVAALSSNATEISDDGKTLTWRYNADEDNFDEMGTAAVTFSMEGVSPIDPFMIAIIVDVVLFLIALVVIIIMWRRHKKKTSKPSAPQSEDNGSTLRKLFDKELADMQTLMSAGILTSEEYEAKRTQVAQAFESAQAMQTGEEK